MTVCRVLRDPTLREDLIRACRLTPYAREQFDGAYEPTGDSLERARRTCVRAAMGFGSAGATKATTGFRTDTRRKYGTAQHNWAAQAIASEMGRTLLLAWSGETFALSAAPVWVQQVATGLSVARGKE